MKCWSSCSGLIQMMIQMKIRVKVEMRTVKEETPLLLH